MFTIIEKEQTLLILQVGDTLLSALRKAGGGSPVSDCESGHPPALQLRLVHYR
jgi:hypothetical protein